MLKFIAVNKNFGDIVALEDINFRIDEGEFVFLTGPSGAGKTTLLKLLIREYKPSSGEIYYGDWQIHNLKKKEVPHLRQSIGSVFQDFHMLDQRTVRENVEVALAVKNVPRNEWEDRVEHVLKLVGLENRIDLFPLQLSGGELQRAVIARALVVNPDLIFADEPTGNLDWKTTEQIMELFEKINNEGKTIIVTTHNEKVVDKMKKRVIELNNGKLSHDSDPKDLQETKNEQEDNKEDKESNKQDEKEEKEDKKQQ